MEQPKLQEGTVLAGRYRLVRLLGSGAMGAVWLATRPGGGEVAVKFLLPTAAKDDRLRARFEREAQVARDLDSPHLVRVFEHGFAGELPFMVMERLVGEDLARRLRVKPRLSLREIAPLVSGVARGVAAAHARGLVHRDLKPANVYLAQVGGAQVVKVLDFGVVKVPGLGVSARTRTGELIGTPKFMSPEQLRGDRDVDSRADLWAIGVIAYRAATGRQPFEAPNLADEVLAICTAPIPRPSSVAPGLPPAFDDWFARACCREVAGRFSTAAELASALEAVASEAPAAPPSGGGWGTPPRSLEATMVEPPVARSGRSASGPLRLSTLGLVALFTTALGISIGGGALVFRAAGSANGRTARASGAKGAAAPGLTQAAPARPSVVVSVVVSSAPVPRSAAPSPAPSDSTGHGLAGPAACARPTAAGLAPPPAPLR